jgi:hypothetical protein
MIDADSAWDHSRNAMKAGVFCCVCGALSFPELGPPGTCEDFDLLKLDDQGRPAEADAGRWPCSRHYRRIGANQYRCAAKPEAAE